MKKSSMKQGEKEVKQPHISEGMNINSDECEVKGGKQGELTQLPIDECGHQVVWLSDGMVKIYFPNNSTIIMSAYVLERIMEEYVKKLGVITV